MLSGPSSSPQRLFIIGHDLSNNAAGRAHVIWKLGRFLGLDVEVHGTARGELWKPLEGTDFAAEARTYAEPAHLTRTLRSRVSSDDLLIPIKTWPGSLGIAVACSRSRGAPVLADIDDPDHAALVGKWASFTYRHAFRLRMRMRSISPREFDRLESHVRTLPRMFSNPILRDLYDGGWVVPHARQVPTTCPTIPDRSTVTVAFVGTPRKHKGLALIRQAVESRHDQGIRLVVTSPPPRDAKPWETWVGVTSTAEGRQIIADADAVVIAQEPTGYGHAQLPARLIDAMSLGRPVIATETPPIRWALGDYGLIIPGTSPTALTRGLDQLLDHGWRVTTGQALHQRAAEVFSLPAVAKALAGAISEAMDTRDG